jgi:hypothetical protein
VQDLLEDVTASLTDQAIAVLFGLGGVRAVTPEPIPREVVEWFADRTPEVFTTLGPVPRRTRLYHALGELVDLRLIEPSVQGFTFTEVGNAALQAAIQRDPGRHKAAISAITRIAAAVQQAS